jgi:exodeoxyribonuclease VII small subunit
MCSRLWDRKRSPLPDFPTNACNRFTNSFPAWENFVRFFDSCHEKDWTLLPNSCITIEGRSETPLPKFEECLQRLEKIVQELEKGEIPLEMSLTLFEEGMQLSSACRKELEQAEGKVEVLLKKNGKLQAEPFEALTEKSPARR